MGLWVEVGVGEGSGVILEAVLFVVRFDLRIFHLNLLVFFLASRI